MSSGGKLPNHLTPDIYIDLIIDCGKLSADSFQLLSRTAVMFKLFEMSNL